MFFNFNKLSKNLSKKTTFNLLPFNAVYATFEGFPQIAQGHKTNFLKRKFEI